MALHDTHGWSQKALIDIRQLACDALPAMRAKQPQYTWKARGNYANAIRVHNATGSSSNLMLHMPAVMRHAGFDVVEAVDGVDAFAKARSRSFDLVLTDQNMPRLDGIGLTRRLRGCPGFETTPILILTTESGEEMKQAGRAAGASGWMVKPFDPAKLVEVIRHVVR